MHQNISNNTYLLIPVVKHFIFVQLYVKLADLEE